MVLRPCHRLLETFLQLEELNLKGHFDSDTLRSFPELLLCPEKTPGQAAAGGSPSSQTLRRGKRRGGARRLHRLVSKGQLTLPVILFTNVQSLVNKMDNIFCRIATQKYIQDCTILCFCKTWLQLQTPDEAITPAGYSVYRATRQWTVVKLIGKAQRSWSNKSGAPTTWRYHSHVLKMWNISPSADHFFAQ